MLLVHMEASLLYWVFWKCAMPYVPASVSNLRTVCLLSPLFILYAVCPFHPGEPDAQWLAGDFGICRGPGRDARGSQQWCSDPDGEGRPGLPQIGERKPNGRMEILHLLRLPGVPHVERKRRRRCRDGNKGAGGSWKAKGRWRKGRWRKKKKDMVKMGGKHDNRLVFGMLQRKDEMLERYERDVMWESYRAGTWQCTVSFFTLLPLFIHPFMHPSPPSVSSWLDCSFGQPKPFLYSADRRNRSLIWSRVFWSPRVTLPPVPTLTNPIISSSIAISISFDQYYLSNYSSLTPVYCAHMCVCVFLMLDINATDFGSASSSEAKL